MIESLHISGFKLFRDITLPKLGRLNLFVGENNSGKSCLLEAVSLYAGRTPLADVLQAAALRRGDRVGSWDPLDLTEEATSITHPVFELFHRTGRTFAREIIIGKIGDPSPLRVQFATHRIVADGEGFRRYVPVAPGDVVPAESVEIALPVFRGERQVGLVTRRMLPRSRTPIAEKLPNEDALSTAFLPASGFSEEKAATLWDALVQGPGQGLVLDWLRMLDPGIEDLAYVAGRLGTFPRLALLKVEGQSRIPLRSMGDGLTKLFHIALAVASAPRGVLLIDEFENGLHWSVQEKLWVALVRAARDSSVQVFCTTHSRDCIKGFATAVRDARSNDASIYRLERKADGVLAVDLPLINVDAAIRENGELR
jgi:energy-coupling factor transporter ATP-binding protein EcfA2